jgi:hypothetical protein
MRVDKTTGEVLATCSSSDHAGRVTFIRGGNRRARACPSCCGGTPPTCSSSSGPAPSAARRCLARWRKPDRLRHGQRTVVRSGPQRQGCGQPHYSCVPARRPAPRVACEAHRRRCRAGAMAVVAPGLWRQFSITLRRLLLAAGRVGRPGRRARHRAAREGGRVPAAWRRPHSCAHPPRRTSLGRRLLPRPRGYHRPPSSPDSFRPSG